MRGLDTEVIEQSGQIAEIGVEADAALEIEVLAGFALAAPVRPDDFIEAAQVRHPRAPEFRRARIAVLQDHVWRVFPRIGEIVELVIERRLARPLEMWHGS